MTIKATALSRILFISFLTLTPRIESKATVLHWPQLCSEGRLTIENKTLSEASVWLQKFDPELTTETFLSVKENQKIQIGLSIKSSSERFALLHFLKDSELSVQFSCNDNSLLAHNYEGGVYYFQSSDLNENKLWLQNLFPGINTVKIELLDKSNQLVKVDSLILKSYEQKNYKILIAKTEWQFIRVYAENRMTAFNISSRLASGPFTVQPQFSSIPGDMAKASAFFVIASNDHENDSFIVKINDPIMIEKAREQIAHPNLEKIIFGKLQKGHGGFNRNWTKSEKPFWSWSVSEVTNIADIGSTACNGVPQLVENRLTDWLQDPGRICFWSYRIKRELTVEQVQKGYE